MHSKQWTSLSGFLIVGGLAAFLSMGCEENGGFATSKDQKVADHDVDPRIPPKTHFAAGRLLERRGDFEGAIKQYRRAIALSADYVDALNRLGVTLDRLGRFDEADGAFTEAIILRPGEPYLRNNLAFSYMLQRRWNDAEAELRNALVLDPNFERARVNLGLVLARQQRFEDALTAFTLALPESDAYYNMGIIYRQHDLFTEAQAAFNRSLLLDPGMEAARRQLESIEKRITAIDTQRQHQRQLAEERRLAQGDDVPAIETRSTLTPNPTWTPGDGINDPACEDNLAEAFAAITRTPNNPIAEWEDAMAETDEDDWTVPVAREPERLSLTTALLLSDDVHDVARSAVRDVMAFRSQLALAEQSRRAMRESAPLEPIDEPVNDLITRPSVSTDPPPTARVVAEPTRNARTIASPLLVPIDPLDGIAAVDGPTAGRVSLFGFRTLRNETHAGPTRRVSEQRHAALAKYQERESAPRSPHGEEGAIGPSDRLPNRPMRRTAGSCQCTDRWKEPLLPRE